MKKTIIALTATATLFAGCASDTVVGSPDKLWAEVDSQAQISQLSWDTLEDSC